MDSLNLCDKDCICMYLKGQLSQKKFQRIYIINRYMFAQENDMLIYISRSYSLSITRRLDIINRLCVNYGHRFCSLCPR